MRKYFGTDGIRGKVGGSLINPDVMLKLGYALGLVLKETTPVKPCVLIGRDTRISGELLQGSLQAGLITAGVDVVLLGVISTPAIAYFTELFDASAGVVISASHNPYQDNGVKIIGKNGMKLSDASEKEIEYKMDAITELHPAPVMGEITQLSDTLERYVGHVVGAFPSLDLSSFRFVVDCANGATSALAQQIFPEFAGDPVFIHVTPDGYNINERCGATHLESLRAEVLKTGADFGVAFDGDGDRLMMVDHQGEIVDGDEILCLLACYSGEKHLGVVGTQMSNLGLAQAIGVRNIPFERVAVGDRYVLEKLLEKQWTLGGEGSGHIINLHYAKTGDGIMTALQVMQILGRENKSLHDLKQGMKKCPQVLINVPVKDTSTFTSMTALFDAAKQYETALGNRGRILLRASGTESCVRVMVEAIDEKEAREIAQALAKCVI